MSPTTTAGPAPAPAPPLATTPVGLRRAVRDGLLVARRDVSHWVREPQKILWGLAFPVVTVLLFANVFGSGIVVPGGEGYRELLMPGIFVQTMAFGIGETLAAVQADAAKGVTDRFRSMPIASSAVVVGRCLAAMLYSVASLGLMVGCGLAIGWRWRGSATDALAAFGLLLLLRFAFLWVGILLGLKARTPEAANSVLGLLYPVTMISNAFVAPEHKPEVVAIADHVVDLGPGAGRDDGHVVFAGDLAGLRTAGTRTGDHLDRRQPVKTDVRTPTGALRIEHARLHNLQDVTVDVPLGVLVAVTGVAGSGKSSLIHGCLPRVEGLEIVDQGAIRGSRRSNPGTYSGLLEPVRKAFAKANGVKPALFSANSECACPQCKGLGLIYTDLAFMAGVASVCEVCEGRRFTDEVLGHRLRGATIADVLTMSVAEAAEFFTEKPVLAMLRSLADVGLGYVTLGQPLTPLSGGKRQRLKLAIHLAGTATRVFVLDEPTTGLHMADVDGLVALLDRIVDRGRSVVVIEHNLDVVARADWVVDLGPGAGHDGGRVGPGSAGGPRPCSG